MKNNKMFSRLSIALVIMLVLSSVQSAFATGTTAGTAISNTASVTFTDGSNSRSKTSNTISFFVGHKVAGSFSTVADQTALQNQSVYIPVSFSSTSNYSTTFSVGYSLPSGTGTGKFTPSTYELYVDNGTPLVFDGADVLVSGNEVYVEGSPTTKNYLLKITTPASLNNDDSARVRVTFTNFPVDNSGADVFYVNSGFSTDRDVSVRIQKPVVSVTITQTPPTPAIPGAPVQYSVVYSNTGTTNPTSAATFTFVVPSGLTWNGGAGPTTLATTNTLSSPVPPTPSDVSYSYSAGTVTITIPQANLAYTNFTTTYNTNTQTFSFGNLLTIDTTVATGPASGATITTSGTSAWPAGSYSISTGSINFTPNSTSSVSNITVATSYGFKWIPVNPINSTLSTGSNEIVEFQYFLKNMGNTTNSVNLTKSHNATGSIADSATATTVYFASSPLTANAAITENSITSLSNVAKGTGQYVYVRVYTRLYKTGSTPAVLNDSLKKTITASAVTTTGNIFYGYTSTDDNGVVVTKITMQTLSISMEIDSVLRVGFNDNYTAFLGASMKIGPSDTVVYKITVSNGSAASISNILISNAIQTELTHLTNGYGSGEGITIDDGVTVSNLTTGADIDVAQVVGTTFSTSSSFSLNGGATRIFRYRCIVD
ncbi:MAG: hypothetical protein WDA22_06650 [Bacteroidota bacterium]